MASTEVSEPVVRNMSIRSRGPLREKAPPPTGQIVMQRYRVNIQVTNLHTVERIVRRGERDSSRETEQISPEVRHTVGAVIYQDAATAERLQHGNATMAPGGNTDLCSPATTSNRWKSRRLSHKLPVT